MNKEDIKGYTNRVIQANKSELIVILYDIILQDLQEAREHLQACRLEEYQKSCDHSCRAVNELIVSLDFQYSISAELFRLYKYVNACVANAKTSKKEELLEKAYITMEKLRSAFVQVANLDKSEPVMQNTEQVYAGLTYSKGNLNESLSEASLNRGYRA